MRFQIDSQPLKPLCTDCLGTSAGGIALSDDLHRTQAESHCQIREIAALQTPCIAKYSDYSRHLHSLKAVMVNLKLPSRNYTNSAFILLFGP